MECLSVVNRSLFAYQNPKNKNEKRSLHKLTTTIFSKSTCIFTFRTSCIQKNKTCFIRHIFRTILVITQRVVKLLNYILCAISFAIGHQMCQMHFQWKYNVCSDDIDLSYSFGFILAMKVKKHTVVAFFLLPSTNVRAPSSQFKLFKRCILFSISCAWTKSFRFIFVFVFCTEDKHGCIHDHMMLKNCFRAFNSQCIVCVCVHVVLSKFLDGTAHFDYIKENIRLYDHHFIFEDFVTNENLFHLHIIP